MSLVYAFLLISWFSSKYFITIHKINCLLELQSVFRPNSLAFLLCISNCLFKHPAVVDSEATLPMFLTFWWPRILPEAFQNRCYANLSRLVIRKFQVFLCIPCMSGTTMVDDVGLFAGTTLSGMKLSRKERKKMIS